MSANTPGPWKLDGGEGQNGELYVWNDLTQQKGMFGSNEVCVATINAGRVSPEQIKANAKLVMAAPDLLASLREMVAWLLTASSMHLDGEEIVRLKRAEAALSKAGYDLGF